MSYGDGAPPSSRVLIKNRDAHQREFEGQAALKVPGDAQADFLASAQMARHGLYTIYKK